jgi:branched-chain amino acid transport system substrate-binding protein
MKEPMRIATALTVLMLTACRPSAEPVRIGLAGPFSDPVGGPMLRAAELAVEEINAAGGIGGRPIELIARDDRGDPDSAVSVAADLVAEGVAAVIGHVYSGTTLAAAPVYGAGTMPIPVITPSSSAPEVAQAGRHVFRLCPTDLEHGAALATWIRGGLGLTRAAVLYLNNAYGRGVRQSFVTRFTALGGVILESDPYLGDSPDVGTYLERITADGQAELLVVAGNRTEALSVLTQARERGIMLPVFGGDGLEGLEQDGAIAEGVTLTAAYFPTVDTPQNQRFVRTYLARHPGSVPPNQPAAAAYDAVYLLRDVIAVAGGNRRAIITALTTLGSDIPPYQGVTGILAFDGAGDLARMPVLIGVVRSGTIVQVEQKR